MKNGIFTRRKCPRCGGTVYVDRSYYRQGEMIGWFEQETCLQCGHINYNPGDSQQSSQRITRYRRLS